MSYFIIANGSKPDLSELAPITVLPCGEYHRYVFKCVEDFKGKGISGYFWFIDDGKTTTSDEIIINSYYDAVEVGTWKETPFYRVLKDCDECGASLFIWYGNHDTHLHLKEVYTFIDLVEATIGNKGLFFGDVGVYYRNSK